MLHLLSKIFQLSATPPTSSALMRRRERADTFCEAIRALDASGLFHFVSLSNWILRHAFFCRCFYLHPLIIEAFTNHQHTIIFLVLDLSATSIRELFLPTIQNLLKDLDALDPAHKEALEIIMKERSGGTFETISKVMGAHLGIASSVSSFFGDSGLLGKKETLEQSPTEQVESPTPVPPPPAEDTRFRRIMRGSFTDMLRGKVKNPEDSHSL